ncbi:MAG: asparagine synthase-related protein, partial [Planctomycetota bacterium]
RRGKKVLKDALLPWLGRELLERPKQGFSIPLSEWLKGSLQALRDAALSGDFAESYLNRQSLARFAEEHDSGRRDRSEALWAVLVLHLWYEQWGRST